MTIKEFNRLTRMRAKVELDFLHFLKEIFTDKQLDRMWEGAPDKAFGKAWATATKRMNWLYRNRNSVYLSKEE